SSWEIRIPEGVREVIGRRLDRLSERCNEVLTIAAVIGRQFRFGVLMKLVEDASENMLLDVLDEALDARIVEEVPTEVGLYQFAHALIQQTLSDELSTTRTVRLHARIAEALEQLWGSESQQHAAELAHHFIEAESLGVSGKLAEYALLAGEEAISRAAYQDAARYFESALSALDGGVNDGRKARILFGLARAGVVLADGAARQAAMDRMAEAFDSYEAIGDVPSAIKVAQEPVDILQLTGVTELAKRGLRLAEPGSLDEGWLLSRYGTALHAERGEFELAHEALNTALAISKQHNDLGLEARITTNLTQRLSAHDELAAAIEHGERAEELISSLGDTVSEIRIGTFLANAYLGVGDVRGAERVISKLSSAAESLNAASYRSYGWELQARLATLCGEWARVADIAKEAAAGTEAGWLSGIALEEARILFEKGDSDGAELKFSSKIGDGVNWREPAAAASIAWVAHRATGQDMLERVKDLINRGAGSADKYRSRARSSQTVLAMIAVEEADSESADRLYADLVGRDGGMDPTTGISTGHILGLLASSLGRSSDASAHLESGIEFCRSAGYRPELAWTCSDYAEMLLERNVLGDSEKATELQDEAIAIAQELGMRPLIERVLAQREILKA
ncbi:MAG: hypothetical protein IH961_11110, partial [Chloroflexi bacterium]|nr:hypothetical protein [Chloroflexota bacterium]